MSSGSSIPYHLRHNKAVDRNLFVDLLTKVNNVKNISDYTYISFGGPYLEDFKVINSALKIKKMISLEVDENTHKRQKFNMPLSCIDIGKEPLCSGDFLDNYTFAKRKRHIVWLDYTDPAKINEQLGEIESISNKLNPFDILKITMNAHAETIGRDLTLPINNDPREYRARKLEETLGAYLPYPLNDNHSGSKTYPTTLLHAVKKAMRMGISSRSDLVIEPVSAFIYADGQTMLTATAVVLKNEEVKINRFFSKSRLSAWPFLNRDWESPRNITVPSMSLKERLFIESLLPHASAQEIIDSMEFLLADDHRSTTKQLKTFIEYQRAIPWFSKVVF
ncbi:O-methyltransferase [Rouxiella sp. T17]|uniref:O-methyltransferase n=1 Tax=Rouxiella sp. T17 TaxID=3085684 RepID=UPI002FCC7303